ncbi:uncharacterized protein LOC135090787 [Scylla paramamosain]|uniref:uncharacterized protein LOC135090787 n=1 Tax=Scylla paramamosain TaxID=85552 RepID=UPI003083AC0E
MVGRARKRRRGGGEEEEANRGALSDCRPFVWRGRKQDGMKDSHVEEAAVTGEQQRAVALSVTAASPRHRVDVIIFPDKHLRPDGTLQYPAQIYLWRGCRGR